MTTTIHPTASTSPPLNATDDTRSRPDAPRRRVTDAPTRMFHWLFAACFLGAYLTADGERLRLLHVVLGYTMAGLLGFRIVYGLFGPRPVALGALWRKVQGWPAWLRGFGNHTTPVNWRQGQNLALATTVVLMLGMVVPLTLTGYATYNDWGDALGGDWLGEIHEWFGESYLYLVLGHIGLLALLSLLRRQNQALPMLTGHQAGKGPDLVQRNRVWLAGLILIAVLSYWTWEWQQSPKGLISADAVRSLALDDEDDD